MKLLKRIFNRIFRRNMIKLSKEEKEYIKNDTESLLELYNLWKCGR